MKQRWHFFNYPFASLHRSKFPFAFLTSQFIALFKNLYIFWVPLIAATALALTTTPAYHGIVVNDKVLHTLTFLYLTFAWSWINSSSISLYRIVSFVFLYGLLIEYIQSFIPSRSCSIDDAIANGAGCLLGFILIRLYKFARLWYNNSYFN